MSVVPLGVGVIGLGRAFTLMLPTFLLDHRLKLVAATDTRVEARQQFVRDFDGRVYESASAMCSDPLVEVVYVASPHQFHAEHAIIALEHGKHVLLEKPMAVSVGDSLALVAAADEARRHVVVGHSHSFDAPILKTRELILSGKFGCLGMINAMQFTDFMFRPRRREELVTELGGGVVFSQGAHQVDIVRLLAGGMAKSVRAGTGAWDNERPSEGAYSAFVTFEGDVFASLTYSGFAHFDSDELVGWVGEGGQEKSAEAYWTARGVLKGVRSPEEEAALKASRTYGGSGYSALVMRSSVQHQHFGFVVASCARGDLRPFADRVMVYGDDDRFAVPLEPPSVPRSEVVDELWRAVREDVVPLHSARWGLATLEVCLAIIQSAKEQREVRLVHQVPAAVGGH